MKRPTTRQFIASLNRAGISYHSTGSITFHGMKYGEFYKTDRLSLEQRETLKSELGRWVEFKTAAPEYAPEQSAALIIHRSAGKLIPA
jgi:hypothetical protein